MKNRRNPISFEAMVEHLEATLDPAASQEMRERLDTDRVARGIEEKVRYFLDALRDVVSEEEELPSLSAVQFAQDMFRERMAAMNVVSLPVLIARLSMVGRNQIGVAGIRSGEPKNLRALYTTEEHDVDLWQERVSNGVWYLMGQILTKQGDSIITPRLGVLSSEDGSKIEVEMSQDEFYVPSVPTGRYELMLEIAQSRIVLPNVVVG